MVPLIVLLLVYTAIRVAKWLRRRRRRTTGATATRVSGGWREVVDTARDMQMPLPVKGTRLEQAHALESEAGRARLNFDLIGGEIHRIEGNIEEAHAAWMRAEE